MRKRYPTKSLLFIAVTILLFAIASCKKNNNSNGSTSPVNATPTKLGLYEIDSSIYKLLYIGITKIGNQDLTNANFGALLFDTGSGGMVIDADSLVSSSMITSSGFNFTGDSVVVNGITITNQTSIVEYGDDDASIDKVYGNLAYASVTIGDSFGNIVVKRLPFFLYYKAVDASNKPWPPHEFDTFGVSSEYDISFKNGAFITSPFSNFDPGTGLTKGFKMAALGTSNFSLQGNDVPNVLTLGLTADDLSSSSGFTMSQLNFISGDGYAPVIPANITYNNKTVSSEVIFDTGTEPYSYIEDPTFKGATTLLPSSTSISTVTTSGFTYSFTTSATNNLTYVENPNTSGGDVSIMSLDYFINNEYLLDFTDHKMGLKNN
jgi:hypothetical protein